MKNSKIFKEDLYKSTIKDTNISLKIINECKRLGLPYDKFDNNNNSKDELLAITLVMAGKKIPEDLEKRLLETKDIRNSNNTPIVIQSNISNNEIEQWIKSDTNEW